MDLLQYMRTVCTCARNTLFVLHAVQVAARKKMVYVQGSTFVTKEIYKAMLKEKEEGKGGEEGKKGDGMSGKKGAVVENGGEDGGGKKSLDQNRGNRYSYRILKNQLLKGE